ncbi:MAG: outer membrane protein assembly factor BamD [candidate division WOR-3 bacterium]
MLFFLLLDLPDDPKVLYEIGLKSFNNKDYKTAEKVFKRIIYSLSFNDYTDKAQYYLALTYFNKKQYDLAKIEAEFFVNNFRYSEFYPDALILLSLIYYKLSPNPHRDITELNKAIELLDRVKLNYPEYSKKADSVLYLIREKFAQKVLISANVYRNLNRLQSEAIYLEYYLNNYVDIQPDSVGYRLMEIYEILNEREKLMKLTDFIIKSEYFSNWIKKLALEKREKYGNSSSWR